MLGGCITQVGRTLIRGMALHRVILTQSCGNGLMCSQRMCHRLDTCGVDSLQLLDESEDARECLAGALLILWCELQTGEPCEVADVLFGECHDSCRSAYQLNGM